MLKKIVKLYMNKFVLTFVSVFFLQLAHTQLCNQDNRFTEVAYFSLSEIDSISNQVYGSAPDHLGTPTDLLLDVYYPKGLYDSLDYRPLVLMIHGGGFQGGNKNDRKNESITFAQRGYVAVTMSYRLGWNPATPSSQLFAMYRAQQDANAALRYLVANFNTFAIDTNWMFIGGSSAGAITANKVVYAEQSEWNSVYPGIETALGLLDTSGNGLTNTFELKGMFNNWGAVPLEMMQLSEMIPQIAFHGALDNTVEIDTATFLMGSRSIHYELINNGICSDITVDTNGLHGIYTNLTGAVFRASKASCFFRSVICDNCSNVYTTDSIPANCAITLALEDYQSEYILHPNPTNGILVIKGLEGNERITIYDLSGKLILKQLGSENLDLSFLESGLYLLAIENQLKTKTIRFIKE